MTQFLNLHVVASTIVLVAILAFSFLITVKE